MRRDACRDLDAWGRDADVVIATSCAGIGTDWSIAFRESFLKLRAGERSPGPRQALQAAGRTGRRDDVPLAPYVGFDGERHERGAANALLCGCAPPMPREKVDQRDAGVAGGRYANAAKRCRPDAEECARQVAYTRDDVDAAHRTATTPSRV